MSADLLRRLFHLTRAQVGSRSPPPSIDEQPIHDRPGDPGPAAPAPDEKLAGYYANLEIPYGSDAATVRAAWKDLMKKYHPDLHGADVEKQRLAGEITARLTRACQELEAALERGNGRG
ncbi:MAG: J domain-containing protein [Gemmatimonadaceae bacterium]|nr:J domain-containing protein [Gemmatimonadaceae bacterium]